MQQLKDKADFTPCPNACTWSTVTVSLGNNRTLTYDLIYVTTPERLLEAERWVKEQSLFALDLETSGLDPLKDKVATLQVGNPLITSPVAYVVDVRCFSREQLDPFIRAIADPARVKLGQNIKFECRFCITNFGHNILNVRDTQVSEMVIRAGLLPSGGAKNDRAAYAPASMDALCKRYLGIKIQKGFELRTSFYSTKAGGHSQEQLEYAAGDVIYPFFLAMEQEKEISARALGSVVKVEHALIPILAAAEVRGMCIDQGMWRDLWQEAKQGLKETEEKLHALILGASQLEMLVPDKGGYKVLYPRTNRALNYSSPIQVKYAIHTYCQRINWPVTLVLTDKALLGLKKKYGGEFLEWKRKSNPSATWDDVPDTVVPDDQYCILLSTSADVLRLARLKKQLPAELVTLLLDYARYDILSTTFGNDFLVKHVAGDGKVHTEFHQCVPATGRLSASPNLMNIPRNTRYRKAFIPAPGYKFVIADYSQIEPRLSAQESQDPIYLNTFQNMLDIYVATGESMLGQPIDKHTEEGALRRQWFKEIVLAMAYRMGPHKLQRRVALALEKAILAGKVDFPDLEYVKQLHKQFLSTFSKLHEYQNRCSGLADPNPKEGSPRVIWDRYLNAPVTWASSRCGRKRFFPPGAKNTYTEAANSPIQGCSATITKAAMVLLDVQIRKRKFDAGLVNVVHDELIYECREEQAEEFAQVLKTCMEKAGAFYLPDVPVLAEFPENSNGVVPFWTKKLEAENAA